MIDMTEKNLRTQTIFIYMGLLIAFYVYHCLYWYGRSIDDAYITFRYARNFSNGLGLVYNPGERVEGYTNFSWVMLSALGIKLNFYPILVAKIMGVASGVGAIICIYWIYTMLSPVPYSIGSFLGPLLLATNSYFCFWSITGMETVFFSFILILAIALFIRGGKYRPLSACFFGLLCLTRPDGFGYITIVMAADIIACIRQRRRPDKYQLKFYGILSLILFCFITFKLIYYGDVYPNSYYAKTMLLPFMGAGLDYLSGMYVNDSISLPVIIMGILIIGGGRLKHEVWFLIAFVLANWFYVFYVRSDWMPNYRHHMYTLPVLFVFISVGINTLICKFDRQKRIMVSIIIAMLLAHHIYTNISIQKDGRYNNVSAIVRKPGNWLSLIPEKIGGGIKFPLANETMFLVENTDSKMTIATRDIGYPGFITGLRIYDTGFIVNQSAKRGFDIARGGDEKSISDYIFNTMRKDIENYNPDFFIYHLYDLNNAGHKQGKFWLWLKWSQEMHLDYFNT